MANSNLQGKTFSLPEELLKKLQEILNNYQGDKHSEGYVRLKNLISVGKLSYQNMKNIKHILEKNKGNKTLYLLNGGSALESWINSTLGSARNRVENTKKAKKESGESNAYIRSHSKDGSETPKVRTPKLYKSMSSNDLSTNNVNYESVRRKKVLMITESQMKMLKLRLNEEVSNEDINKIKGLIATGEKENLDIAKLLCKSLKLHIDSLIGDVWGFYLEKIYGMIPTFKNLLKMLNQKHLSLSNLNLNEIPQEVAKFKKLNSLALFGNNIKDIPDFILNMPNLQMIYLLDNNLNYEEAVALKQKAAKYNVLVLL